MRPGAYDERNLLKDGVNWFFLPGATIASAAAGALWDDSPAGARSPVACQILGYGQFLCTATDGEPWPVKIVADGSSVEIQCESILSARECVVKHGAGTLLIRAQTIRSSANTSQHVVARHGGTLEILEARISASGSARAAVCASDGPGSLVLRNAIVSGAAAADHRAVLTCENSADSLINTVLVAGPATSYGLAAVRAGAKVKCMGVWSNRASGPGITTLVGGIAVDADVAD